VPLPDLRVFGRIVLTSLLVPIAITALPNRQAAALPEAEFQTGFETQALPLVERTRLQFFRAADGTKIAYRSFPATDGTPARGTVVFVHGYSESMLKHAEIIYDLTQAGYNLYALDLRGMGESQRLLDERQIGHVEKFSDYVTDLKQFVTNVVVPASGRPLFLLAHSLGGMVSTDMLADGTSPFTAVAYSAPMFGIRTRGFPPWLVSTVIGFNVWRGKGSAFRPGGGLMDPSKEDGSKSSVTHSAARANATLALYKKRPDLTIGGQSNKWMAEAIAATSRATRLARKISVPIRIFQAEEDAIVTAEGQQEFCAAAPHCELRIVAGARHEILQESDSMRTPVIGEILNFFQPQPLVN